VGIAGMYRRRGEVRAARAAGTAGVPSHALYGTAHRGKRGKL
jgi:hypothetical protein